MMISDLPPDLESEILSRVPSKFLVELKTTCKRWYTLFKNPKFVKKNLCIAAREEEMILLMNPRVYSISFNLHGINNSFDPTMEFTGKLCTRKVSKIFHCDGLVLCTTKEEDENPSLVVWNPCTGQTKMIKPRDRFTKSDFYALGYGNINELSCPSYKILRFCCYDDYVQDWGIFRVVEFEIYDLSTDSWRVLDDDLTQKWDIIFNGLSFRGNAYWTAGKLENLLLNILLFDFTTERFECLPLPYQSPRFGDNVVLSVVRDEKLALLCQNIHLVSFEVNIWVTTKTDAAKELSWSKLFVAGFDNFVSSFLLDEENKVAVCCGGDSKDEKKGIIYIVGEDIHKQVYKEITKESRTPNLVLLSYVPSLVHIQNNTIESKQKEMQQREGTVKMRP